MVTHDALRYIVSLFQPPPDAVAEVKSRVEGTWAMAQRNASFMTDQIREMFVDRLGIEPADDSVGLTLN